MKEAACTQLELQSGSTAVISTKRGRSECFGPLILLVRRAGFEPATF